MMDKPWNGYVCHGYTGKEMIETIIEAFEKTGVKNYPSTPEELWNELESTIFWFFDWAMIDLGKWEKSMFAEFQSSDTTVRTVNENG